MTTKASRVNRKSVLEKFDPSTRSPKISLPRQGTKTTSINLLGRHRSRSVLHTAHNYSPLNSNLVDLDKSLKKKEDAQRKLVRFKRNRRKRKKTLDRDRSDEKIVSQPSRRNKASEATVNDRQVALSQFTYPLII